MNRAQVGEPGDWSDVPLAAGPEAVRDRLLDYLDSYRATVAAKVRALDPSEATTSRVASGWTPLAMVWHLAFMERRWIEWGFAGVAVDDPRGDRVDGHLRAPDDLTVADALSRLSDAGARTRQLVGSADPDALAATGGQFGPGQQVRLSAILLHVFQEYARHAGQLDIVIEQAGGPVGE